MNDAYTQTSNLLVEMAGSYNPEIIALVAASAVSGIFSLTLLDASHLLGLAEELLNLEAAAAGVLRAKYSTAEYETGREVPQWVFDRVMCSAPRLNALQYFIESLQCALLDATEGNRNRNTTTTI